MVVVGAGGEQGAGAVEVERVDAALVVNAVAGAVSVAVHHRARTAADRRTVGIGKTRTLGEGRRGQYQRQQKQKNSQENFPLKTRGRPGPRYVLPGFSPDDTSPAPPSRPFQGAQVCAGVWLFSPFWTRFDWSIP